MNDAEWAERWEKCERALREAAELQVALGAEQRARDAVIDFIDENDFTDALLFGAALVQLGDDRPVARELAALLIPHAEFLVEAERDEPTDPSPMREYDETLERLRSVVGADHGLD